MLISPSLHRSSGVHELFERAVLAITVRCFRDSLASLGTQVLISISLLHVFSSLLLDSGVALLLLIARYLPVVPDICLDVGEVLPRHYELRLVGTSVHVREEV